MICLIIELWGEMLSFLQFWEYGRVVLTTCVPDFLLKDGLANSLPFLSKSGADSVMPSSSPV